MVVKQVTRDDVARRAGTSSAVVSYVVNGGPRPVAPDTRARVEAAIAELGYRPNLMARALRSTRSHVLGLVVPDSSEAFFTELSHAVERAAFESGSLVLLGNSAFRADQESHYIESLANMRVDGLLLIRAEVTGRRTTPETVHDRIPTVYLHHKAPRSVPATSVVLNNRAGGRIAARHLLEHGYGSVGCLTGAAGFGPVADRARGCADELRGTGAAGPVVRTDLDRENARRDVRDWLRRVDRPRALVATADGLALDALNAAAELGLRVPGDLAVIGFGGTRAAAYSWPPLATIAPPFADMAGAALSALHESRVGETPAPDSVLEVSLAPRESCGCPQPWGTCQGVSR